MTRDPREVAHIAAVLLSATGQVEPHHIAAAVTAAKGVLSEAYRQADADEAAAEAARASAETSSEKAEVGAAAKTE